jgi:hypothetical protein
MHIEISALLATLNTSHYFIDDSLVVCYQRETKRIKTLKYLLNSLNLIWDIKEGSGQKFITIHNYQ